MPSYSYSWERSSFYISIDLFQYLREEKNCQETVSVSFFPLEIYMAPMLAKEVEMVVVVEEIVVVVGKNM